MRKRRVVITGLGVNNCLGNSVNTFWDSLIEGNSNLSKINLFNSENYSTIEAGQVRDINIEDLISKREEREIDRFTLLALSASRDAICDSNLILKNEDPKRIGVCLGSGIGGMLFYEDQILKYYKSGGSNREIHPMAVQKITPNALSGRLAMKFDCQAFNVTISTACSSSNHAIGIARDEIANNRADIIITGGAEAPLMPVNYASFDNMRVMSRSNVCRPFDLNRDGFVMGEGAGILILEELEHAKKRKAKIYAEICGYGSSCGAFHMIKIKDGGEDESHAIRLALEDAGARVDEVDYINAHGTGTVQNDANEAKAINSIFGDNNICISSIKGATGHLIGASGAIEAIATVMAINKSLVPPNVNFEVEDPACKLNIAKNPVEKNINIAISNSFGFGNNNVVIVFKKFKED